jgi:phage terminase large subunit
VGAIKGAGSIEDGVEFLKSFDIVVHPDCVHVADELLAYSYKIDKLTQKVLPVLADKANNTIDALRYALEAVRRAGHGKMTSRSTGERGVLTETEKAQVQKITPQQLPRPTAGRRSAPSRASGIL